MKKTIICFFAFFVCSKIFSQSPNYFKFSDSNNQVFDYRRELNYEHLDSYENLNNKLCIEKVSISVIKDDSKHKFEYAYKNGLLKTELSHVHEINEDERFYDEKNRLKKYGDNFQYVYISDLCREVFYQGKLKIREEVSETDSMFKIVKNKFTIQLNTGKTIPDGKSEEVFVYDSEGSLVKYFESNWNFKGLKFKSIKTLFFYYDEHNKLIKIVSGYNEDDIRSITEVFYDENGLMTKLIEKNGTGDYEYEVYFFDYDNYGNWRKSKLFCLNKELETVTREIKYIN